MAEMCQHQLLALSKVADVDVNVKCAFKKPEDDEQAAKDTGNDEDANEENKSADKSKAENDDVTVESNETKLENKFEGEGCKIPHESQLETELNKSDQKVQETAASGDDNNTSSVRPKVIILGFSPETEKKGNEQLSGSGFKPAAGGLFAPESGNCDDWTLLNKDDADKNAKPSSESADDICVKKKKQEFKQEGGFDVLSQDPKIANALMKMRAMGFTNEG
ncbi:hypothetical protein X975_23226, partial [Stegodyphus mimosarum]